MSLENSSSGNSILSKTSQLLSSLIKPTTTASNNNTNSSSSDSTDDELTPIEKTQNSYTYYQQKQEQLKKQQAQANKRRKFFSSSNPASSSSAASLSTVGAFPSPALNSPTSSIVNATGNHHHEPYLNSPLQQQHHHSSHHKPGTITKVRGAQYSLPMNHIAQQPSPMSHFSTTTATVTTATATTASHHNNDSLSTLSNDDESSATPTTHTTSDHQQQQQKSKRVSIETNKNRVLQVDEMKLQQQIQNVHHTSNTININTTTNSTTNTTTSTSHSANASSLSTVSSSSILDDLSNMNQKLKKTTNALAELDLIGNIKRIASSGSNNNNNNNSSSSNNNNSHMTPDSFNYVVDGSSSSSNDSFSPEAIVEMMNTGSKSSRNMNSSDLDDSSNRDEYDQVLNQNKLHKFHVLLNQHDVDLDQLRKLSWNGVPASVRALTWKLLLGYANCNAARRESLLQKKRSEYKQMVERFFNEGTMKKTEYENSLQRQIHIDVPRTNPDVTLFQQEKIQEALERILYVWSVRHPASGYVQGINDMVTPFMIVFLRDELYRRGGSDEVVSNVLDMDASTIDDESFDNMEADSFWCFTQFLDFIQDHYTFAQPGIQRMVHKLEEITRKIDEPLYNHIQNQGLSFIQFAFRWMNCLLMRELSLKLIIRIFDAYLAEGDNFEILHVYVCATFLKSWSERLRKLDFTEMVIFIQHLPTQSWTFKEIATILSQAYMLKVRYDETNHLF